MSKETSPGATGVWRGYASDAARDAPVEKTPEITKPRRRPAHQGRAGDGLLRQPLNPERKNAKPPFEDGAALTPRRPRTPAALVLGGGGWGSGRLWSAHKKEGT